MKDKKIDLKCIVQRIENRYVGKLTEKTLRD